MNFYFFIYYKIYKVILKTPNKDIAEWSSMTAFSLLLLFNLGYLIIITNIYKTLFVFKNQYFMVLIMILILSLNYLLFIRKNRYLKIKKDFSKLSKTKETIFGYLVLLYVIGSIWLFFHAIDSLHTYS